MNTAKDKSFILLFAPSGAGKTTRIRDTYNEAGDVNLNRDAITSDMITAMGLDGRMTGLADQAMVSAALNDAENIYFTRLAECATRTDIKRLIVDYPPGGDETWARQTIDLMRSHGWRITLEGITIHPETSFPGVLSRLVKGMPADKIESILDSYQKEFRSWLDTYRNMPHQFQRLALLSDQAVLYDRSTSPHDTLVPIAEWAADDRIVHKPIAYDHFLGLGLINSYAASFTARIMSREYDGENPTYRFETDIQDLYKSTVPARQPMAAQNFDGPP